MATAKNKISLTELDFDQNKKLLKQFLESQPEFTDFDFDGSGMSILLDLLAANTHYTAFMANMLANESFLDTAIKRDSVVSLSKHLSYTPNSIRASVATLDVTATPQSGDTPDTITLPRNTAFKIKANNKTYTFRTIDNVVIDKDSDGNYIGRGVSVYEGAIVDFAYEVDTNNIDQKFIIPNAGADTSTLKVRVRNSLSDSSTTTFTLADDLKAVKSTSTVYWLQEGEDGFFEVYFGDGTVGKKVVDGNIVILEYVVTNGEEANGLGTIGAASFSYLSGSATYIVNGITKNTTDISAVVSTKSEKGADRQSIDSVKFLAPRYYESQNRAVTARDYRTLIEKNFPYIESVASWGGEEHDTETLGTVFISLKPHTGTTVSDVVKNEIQELLDDLNLVTIKISIVDPDYTYLRLTTKVKYDASVTTKSNNDIVTLVTNTITNYGDTYLEKFDKDFRFSRLTALIDNADFSVLNNLTDVLVEKRITPTAGTSEEFTVKFRNALTAGSLTSSEFTLTGNSETLKLVDDENGVVKATGASTTTTVGTIDYVTGEVVLTIDMATTDNSDGTIQIIATPQDEDVVAVRDQIILLNTDVLAVTAEADSIVV